MRSPFKFLDYFEKKDRASFFGREAEKERLYKLVTHHRLSLIYGPSGTGKTSLIRCGLANRLKVTAWLPIFVKRQQNINESLISVLKGRLREKQAILADSSDPVELLEALNIQYLRPPYLIFDQLEELYIDGSQEERAEFTELIKTIIDAGLSCRIIFVLREEYLGRLYEFEQLVPIYYEQRLRVEPLTAPVVKEEVIQKSFALFNISLAEPSLADRMLENLSGLKQVIPLPYLQVYLDRLWNAAYREQIGEDGIEKPALSVTPTIVDELGTLEKVFADYLTDQQRAIQNTLAERFPACPEDFVRSLLDGLVTPEGTKRSVGIEREGTGFVVQSPVPTGWDKVDSLLLNEGLQALAAARLLRVEEESVELAHDSLAAVIDGQRSAEERQLNLYRQQIRASFEMFPETGDYLSKNKVPLYEENFAELGLPVEQRGYLLASKGYWRKIDEAELERERLVSEEKLSVEREKRRRSAMFSLVALVLAVVALGMFFSANTQKKRALLLAKTLGYNVEELILKGDENFKGWYLQDALTYYANARFLNPEHKKVEDLVDLVTISIEADALVQNGYWDDSEKLFYEIHQSEIGPKIFTINKYLSSISKSKNRWAEIVKKVNIKTADTLELSGHLISIPKNSKINPNLISLTISRNHAISKTNSLDIFPNLLALNFRRITNLKDINSLANLAHLTHLDFGGSDFYDISSLSGLTALESIDLSSNNQISNLYPLSSLPNLKKLDLSANNKIYDITPLSQLTSLTELDLSSNNNISNFSSLSTLTSLTDLNVSHIDSLEGIVFLSNLTSLSKLHLRNNDIVEISPLSNLDSLTVLNLNDNSIVDIASLSNLTSLLELNLSDNNIVDIASLSNLTSLLELNLSDNNIVDIASLSNLTSLLELNLSDNNIVDITSLSNLTSLEILYLDGTGILNIYPLKNLKSLKFLRIPNSVSSNQLLDLKSVIPQLKIVKL